MEGQFERANKSASQNDFNTSRSPDGVVGCFTLPFPPHVWNNWWDYWTGSMLLSLLSFDIPWMDSMCLAVAITLLGGAITGRGTTHGRGGSHRWPVAAWLRPIFAV